MPARDRGVAKSTGDSGLTPVPLAEPWLDKRELARHLGISTRSVERALAEGMPHARIFARVRFQVTAVEEWLEQSGRLERHAGNAPTMGANANGAATRERPAPDTEGVNFDAPQA